MVDKLMYISNDDTQIKHSVECRLKLDVKRLEIQLNKQPIKIQ